MLLAILFVFGIAIGSFLNVVALRYDGEHFLLDPKEIGGRSHCPHCKKTLRWFELVPVLSFIAQRGRCRHCGERIGFQYPIVELISGLIFVFVPLYFSSAFGAVGIGGLAPLISPLSIVWIIIFEFLLLVAYIDILLGIIPDELNIGLFILGVISTFFLAQSFGIRNPSFFGMYSAIFGLQSNIWINHFAAAAFGGLFFGAIVLATRGKGMGMGDVKLAIPLGMLFGWPDIFIISIFAFVIGAAFGIYSITIGKKTMKSSVPFGPFLVLACAIAFFWGAPLFSWYFHMLGL